MDYEVLDSSGTDDGLPSSHQKRVPRGIRITGNGRSVLGSVPYSRMQSEMEIQICNLEQEAYSSVLRAFKAQSDALTWEKEGLITELRKELRVSDEKHRELLARVNSDDVIQSIREWRQTGGHQTPLFTSSQSFPSSRKKQKTSQSVPTGVQSTALHPQSAATSLQPSSFDRVIASGARSRMPKSYPSGPATGRGHFHNRTSSGPPMANDHAEAAASDPLIGRKVMTRWPETNNFYEAVITDYNPLEGRHALVYDMYTPNEAWEWVNLEEIPPEDIRWVGEDLSLSSTGVVGVGRGLNKAVNHDGSVAVAGKSGGLLEGQSGKKVPSAQNGTKKKLPDDIEIYHTETLVKEIEKVLDASQPDPSEMEMAKKMLKEHEDALVEAIAKLAEASDGESDGEQPIILG